MNLFPTAAAYHTSIPIQLSNIDKLESYFSVILPELIWTLKLQYKAVHHS